MSGSSMSNDNEAISLWTLNEVLAHPTGTGQGWATEARALWGNEPMDMYDLIRSVARYGITKPIEVDDLGVLDGRRRIACAIALMLDVIPVKTFR